MDGEPFARVSTPEGDFDLTPDNTEIFTHMGELAMFDYVLAIMHDDRGVFVWSENPNYGQLKELAEAEGVPLHSRLRKLASYVVDAYAEDHMEREDFDSFPEEWSS